MLSPWESSLKRRRRAEHAAYHTKTSVKEYHRQPSPPRRLAAAWCAPDISRQSSRRKARVGVLQATTRRDAWWERITSSNKRQAETSLIKGRTIFSSPPDSDADVAPSRRQLRCSERPAHRVRPFSQKDEKRTAYECRMQHGPRAQDIKSRSWGRLRVCGAATQPPFRNQLVPRRCLRNGRRHRSSEKPPSPSLTRRGDKKAADHQCPL